MSTCFWPAPTLHTLAVEKCKTVVEIFKCIQMQAFDSAICSLTWVLKLCWLPPTSLIPGPTYQHWYWCLGAEPGGMSYLCGFPAAASMTWLGPLLVDPWKMCCLLVPELGSPLVSWIGSLADGGRGRMSLNYLFSLHSVCPLLSLLPLWSFILDLWT